MARSTPEVRDARRRLRALRLSLAPAERHAAEEAIAETLGRLKVFGPGRRVAVYLAMRGEVDLAPSLVLAWRLRSQLYAPRIVNRRRREMAFVPLGRDVPTRAGAFGIEEPVAAASRRLPLLRFDAILVPVLGFDADGNRLGLGAGFYDRALRARRRTAAAWLRPRLVGIAFACQQVPRIEPSPWDVPLDLVVTEAGIIRPRRRARHAGDEQT